MKLSGRLLSTITYLVEGQSCLELLNGLQSFALLLAQNVANLDAVGGLQSLASFGVVIYAEKKQTSQIN